MTNTSRLSVSGLVRGAIVCALYIVITYLMASVNLAVGPVQFRLSEMFNFMAFYNKRYLWAVTLGCMISNLIVPGSLGLPDVIIGGGSTLIFLGLGLILFKNLAGKRFWIFNLQHMAFAVFFAISMITIATELHFLLKMPLLFTWATTAGGEFISLVIGSLIIERIHAVIDLSK